MKKIMFYAKRPGIVKSGGSFRDNALLILYYSIYFCSLAAGSAVYASSPDNGLIKKSIKVICSYPLDHKCLLLLIASAFVFLFCMISAFSCVGPVAVSFIPVLLGISYGIAAMHHLTVYAEKGLVRYLLTTIPGAVILICASLALCAESARFSKDLSLNVLFDQKTELKLKPYFAIAAAAFAFILFSVFIRFIFEKLFTGVFT